MYSTKMSLLLDKAIKIKAIKNNKETTFRILAIFKAIVGHILFTHIPRINGTPSNRDTNFIISKGEIATSSKIIEVGSYKVPQNCKFKGVITIASSVAIAVKLTDNAEFPLAKWVIKLDTLPPGHAATINIPKAILGIGFVIYMSKKVMAGKTIN